jgi:RHS repeat-associated protein
VDSITTTYGGDTDTLMENLTYRPFGGASGMDTGAGGTVGSEYDESGRIITSNPGAEHERTYTYDNNGNLTSINSPSTPYYNRVYEYDSLNRLTHVEMPWKDIDYTYDDVGNRLTEVIDDDSYTYNYVPGTNIIDTVTDTDTIIYTHDVNGNITGIGDMVLTYNQNNRLVMVEEDSVVLGEYTYNGLGQRIIKEVDEGSTIFHYDFDGNIIAESDASGNFSKEYLYRGSSRLALVDVETGELYYYGNDRLGTPQILTDSTNTVVWEAVYDPFGDADINSNSSVVSNFRFPGQYFDQETGLHYNYHRYYDPGTGRYLRADPIGQTGGLNLYLYDTNNPINLIDILGLRIDMGNYVVKNQNVRDNLVSLNQEIVNSGIPDDNFVLKVTGGDRFRDPEGIIRSSTTNEPVPNSSQTSPHLIERGARAIDLQVIGVDDDIFDKALKKTEFLPANTLRDYPDGHTHIALPNRPEYYYIPPHDKLPESNGDCE